MWDKHGYRVLRVLLSFIFIRSKPATDCLSTYFHRQILMIYFCDYDLKKNEQKDEYALLCLAVISLGIYWLIKQIVSIIKLKNEKMKAELMLLKSQVSPHFFFNTLNNLYGLVVKDPQKAQELILKL